MNKDDDLAFEQSHHVRRVFVDDVIDDLHFEKVIARAQRAALFLAARKRAMAHRCRIGAVQAPAGFRELDIPRAA